MLKIFDENSNRLVQKASLLKLSAKTLADNLRLGGFKSLYRGQGIDFYGVREYNAGDNVRSIDWNVTARMGHPFVKLYEEDRELQVFFVLDRSLSMFSGTNKKTRIQVASEAAALLVLACLQNNSSIGAVFFDGKIRFSTKAKTGRDQAMMILSRLDEAEEKIEKGSVLGSALKGAHKLLKKRSLVFVISDFRSSLWQENLARLAEKNDVVAMRITDSLDSELPEIGTAFFSDIESGITRKFPTSLKAFKNAWFEDNRRRLDNWKEFCLRHGASPVILSTADDPAFVLNKFFCSRRER